MANQPPVFAENERISIIFTTLPNSEIAAKIGRHLIENRFAACVNLVPIKTSMYEWEGKIITATEHYLLAKTTQEQRKCCADEIKKLHPYTTPALFCTSVESINEQYTQWVQQMTTPLAVDPTSFTEQEELPSEEDASK